MNLVAALSALGQAIGIVKDLREIDRGIDAAEHKAKLAEVTATLADVKMALTDAGQQLREKDEEIARLVDAGRRKADLVEERGYHYERNPEGKPTGWPFCPVCLEDYLRLYRLAKVEQGMRGSCHCPKCKAKFRSCPMAWCN